MDIMSVLTIAVIMLFFLIIVLLIIYWNITKKAKQAEEAEEQGGIPGPSTKVATQYTTKSIFKFMQFDRIEDNMIVQNNGQKYLMVIECEGVNYDLMSSMEKTAVEAGFVQFLNTLRYPIQLYTQTRTVNIGESLQNYRTKLDAIKKEMNSKQLEYNKFLKTDTYNEKQAEIMRRELIRIRNLYEYGQDVVDDIQKTSSNKNVLRKHYYVVVPYYMAEIGAETIDEEDKKSMVFSELYTRCQALIRALFSCEMKCKILNSNELVELLYIAYNRDESETYSVEKAINAGYNELYATAPDVLDKRMKAIDEQIEKEAVKLARESIDEARAEKERKIKKKEEQYEELVKQMAEALIKENEKYVGKDVSADAIKRINDNEEKKEEIEDEQETKKRTRRTSDGE